MDALKNVKILVGITVKVTNPLGEDFIGTVYSYTTQPGVLVLQVPTLSISGNSYNYRVFRTNQIKELTVLSRTVDESSVAQIHPVDPNKLAKIVQRNHDSYNLIKKTQNSEVSKEAQTIFNAVYKTMPNVRWEGNSIVILDEVKVDPPYLVANVKRIHESPDNDDDEGAASLVKKIIDGVWLKLEGERKGG
ncbi:hypothetical protein BN1211_4314 [Cyberlindnera jadinii]|uniref:AD domain-containing protein n=1 Tax=Cyberlindnera jadinii (strain ATCC 18201 / CBS 1600 / BCRC 20928 / JCM 3617 / NBRC 0987 / NRRL Y-1542) TaxID=983966 RepID=A0A0H5C6G1_CYBJN|nr:hypothetical protein BN1211_4314 [Cyberlindnera jadinii]